MFNSPMLVDFAITAKKSVLHLSNRQVKFFEEFQKKFYRRTVVNPGHQNIFLRKPEGQD